MALNEEEDMTSGGVPTSRNINNPKPTLSTAKQSLQSSQKTSPRLTEKGENAYQMIQNVDLKSVSIKGSEERMINIKKNGMQGNV